MSTRNRFNPWPLIIGQLAFVLASLYVAVAWGCFQWRNPLANRMSFFRDFGAVVRFEKLPEYAARKAQP